jgi:hypothetical protein
LFFKGFFSEKSGSTASRGVAVFAFNLATKSLLRIAPKRKM